MAPSARELRAALRTAKRESQRQAAASPAVPSGTESGRREDRQRSREEEARRIAAAGLVVPWDRESEYGREDEDQSSREKEVRRISALIDKAIGIGAGRGARPGRPALRATARGRRNLGEGSVRTRLGARRLQAEARDARGNEGQIFYTISHNVAPAVLVPTTEGEPAATSPVAGQSGEVE